MANPFSWGSTAMLVKLRDPVARTVRSSEWGPTMSTVIALFFPNPTAVPDEGSGQSPAGRLVNSGGSCSEPLVNAKLIPCSDSRSVAPTLAANRLKSLR